MAQFTAALVQMRSGVEMANNVAMMEELVKEAAAQGANYIQTPEMTGLVQQKRKAFFEAVTEQANDPVVAAASALSKQLGIYLHIGSTPILVDDGRAANRAFFFGPNGGLLATYDKIHMFDVDLDDGESWRESAVYRPGETAVCVDALNAKFGLTICYDVRFPQLHTAYARTGVEILTGPSCFTRQTGRAHWHALLRSRAIECGAFMIAAAQGGDMEDGRETYGHSLIVNPWGEVIAEVKGESPGIALAVIETNEVKASRGKVPNLVNNRDYSMLNASAEKQVA